MAGVILATVVTLEACRSSAGPQRGTTQVGGNWTILEDRSLEQDLSIAPSASFAFY